MPSGLLILTVMAIWVAVLTPRVVRLYERTADRRTKRFEHAMSTRSEARPVRRASEIRLLGPAPSTATIGLLLDPAVDLHLDHGIDPFLGGAEDKAIRLARREADRDRAAVVATRRRTITLGVLGLVEIVVLLTAFLGLVTWFAAAAPAGLLVALVVVSRRRSRQEAVRRTELAARAAARRRATVGELLPAAQVVTLDSRRSGAVASIAGGADAGVAGAAAVGGAGGATGNSRPDQVAVAGTPQRVHLRSAARLAEQRAALAATYPDAEAELGLDAYVEPDHAEVRYLRAVGE